jgi:hypothetical protein
MMDPWRKNGISRSKDLTSSTVGLKYGQFPADFTLRPGRPIMIAPAYDFNPAVAISPRREAP